MHKDYAFCAADEIGGRMERMKAEQRYKAARLRVLEEQLRLHDIQPAEEGSGLLVRALSEGNKGRVEEKSQGDRQAHPPAEFARPKRHL